MVVFVILMRVKPDFNKKNKTKQNKNKNKNQKTKTRSKFMTIKIFTLFLIAYKWIFNITIKRVWRIKIILLSHFRHNL